MILLPAKPANPVGLPGNSARSCEPIRLRDSSPDRGRLIRANLPNHRAWGIFDNLQEDKIWYYS